MLRRRRWGVGEPRRYRWWWYTGALLLGMALALRT